MGNRAAKLGVKLEDLEKSFRGHKNGLGSDIGKNLKGVFKVIERLDLRLSSIEKRLSEFSEQWDEQRAGKCK